MITVNKQELELSAISGVSMSDIGTDEDGNYVRVWRFYGPYAGSERPVTLMLTVKSATESGVEITTPQLQV